MALRSMTGYGRGEAPLPEGGRLLVEIKAVNHRFSEVVVRLPRQLSPLEDGLRKLIQERVARGRLDVLVQWEEGVLGRHLVQVDKGLALEYYNALKELAEAIGSKGEISSESIARLPDVLRLAEGEVQTDALWPALAQAAQGAVDSLLAMRQREGEALAADLLGRCDRIEALARGVAGRAPQVVEEFRSRLVRRLDELLGAANPLDPQRLAQEVAIMADKADIAEELARLASHISQFRSILAADEAVGRKLDFLVQELGREINTIGSKSADVTIAHSVVEAKAELEKIKEQVQNVE